MTQDSSTTTPSADIKLVIFDLDWTLVKPVKGGKNPAFRAHEADWQLLPGRVQAMRDLRERHIEIGIATNQGGVAFRIHDPAKMAAEIWQAASMLGIYFVEFCFDHPNGARSRFKHDTEYRKPGGNMLRAIIEKAHVTGPETLYIGDRDEDRQAAMNAKCRFITTAEFFAPYERLIDPDETAATATNQPTTWETAFGRYTLAPNGGPLTYSCPGCGVAITTPRWRMPIYHVHSGLCVACVDPIVASTHPDYREPNHAEPEAQ